ncbi:hypothetical protein O9G_004774 [Rozella allomycis CSF55]|uniref:Uncharacterized protein n=1 Tax=Rozella allomycis (strain CSF55) TaxID=988480 RepID=A0A075AWF4_ROZAC|nr:hypothetical protein O9G_004774 [Rozella allomycis CSF55]|eukprot:EPZ32889.1 hypothetical protein O9G_004774 [Rozella allomycis CSF55]
MLPRCRSDYETISNAIKTKSHLEVILYANELHLNSMKFPAPKWVFSEAKEVPEWLEKIKYQRSLKTIKKETEIFFKKKIPSDLARSSSLIHNQLVNYEGLIHESMKKIEQSCSICLQLSPDDPKLTDITKLVLNYALRIAIVEIVDEFCSFSNMSTDIVKVTSQFIA